MHGGNIRSTNDGGKAYFKAIVKGLGEQPKILLCFFASSPKEWNEQYKDFSERITKELKTHQIKPIFELALENGYKEQAGRADVLFIAGGDCDVLHDKAKKVQGFIESLSTIKVVAGSSAGAILLSKYSWCCDDRDISVGLGTVPVTCMVHYRSESYSDGDPRGPIDWNAAEKSLKAKLSTGEKVTHLPEGEFIVIQS